MNLLISNIYKRMIKSIEWRMRKFNKKYIFSLHEFFVSFFFGKIKNDYTCFKIDTKDVDQIFAVVKKSNKINFSNYLNINKDISKNIFLKKSWNYNKKDKNVYDQFSKTQNWYDLNMTPYLESFINKLLPTFKEYLGSNFSIVNLRAWKNLPNSGIVVGKNKNDGSIQMRGTHRLHTDGFPPGHIKCMIYLQPLNSEFGLFEIGGKKIECNEPGYCIIFKNSDILHRAIPGTKYDRYVIEFTFLRTLFQVNELKYIKSKPDSMYLSAPYFAYF